MLEHYRQPLLPAKAFYRRMARSVCIALAILAVTLILGACIFHFAERFSWIDAALNAVMIMTGLGVTGIINTNAGKLLTGAYALASTFVFFAALAIIFTPLLHRLLHRFHLDIDKRL